MKKKSPNRELLVKYAARILAIVYIGFISLFAVDSFTGEMPFYLELTGFLVHLVPTLVGLVVLATAWKYEQVGSYLFLGLGLISTFFFKTFEELVPFLIISLPLFLCGILFYLSANSSKIFKR